MVTIWTKHNRKNLYGRRGDVVSESVKRFSVLPSRLGFYELPLYDPLSHFSI